MGLELSDALFAKLAGWEAMKQARALLAAGNVLDSEWQPPRLRGRVREGANSYPAGLVIRNALDADNLCPCRTSRVRGLICAHSIAIGLHHLHGPPTIAQPAAVAPATKPTATPAPSRPVKTLRRATPGQPGEPLEISMILPPNLEDILARGKIMLCLEGQWPKGRTPLNALSPLTTFSLSAADTALLDAVEPLAGGDTPGLLMLSSEQWAGILPRLAGHPRLTLGKRQPVEVLAEPLRPSIRAVLEPDGAITVNLKDAPACGLIPGNPPWVFDGERFQPLDLPARCESLLGGPLRIPRSGVPRFLTLDWPRLAVDRRVEANFDPTDFILEVATPKFTLHLEGGLAMLEAKIDCAYHGRSAATLSPDDVWLADPQSPTRYLARNLDAERAALARLLRAGFSGPNTQGRYQLKGQDAVLGFFAREYPRLEAEWQVTLEERLERSTEKHLERVAPRFQVTSSGEPWFDLDIAYTTRGGERFSAADIQRLLRSGQGHTRLANGKFVLLDTGAVEELQEVLLDCSPQQHAGRYRIDNTQAGFLDATLRQHDHWTVRAPADWQQRAARQRGEVNFDPPPLGPLEQVLRPYQKTGVAWLRFLRANGFGGILADEMGLGKTVQVLAHLAAQKSSAAADPATGANHPPCPTLVVCPTSLVFNWIAESAKFTPDLRVLMLHGAQRHEQFEAIDRHDLVVTSYALLRRDAEQYRGRVFDTVVLDEAQHIKNRQTQNAQAVKAIQARHRLVLTGTPLENSVLDLWSIFDFLMPGYLGTAADFRERYESPIVRERDTAAQERLARRLRPFLLRRLKREVAADLPPKIEQVSLCDLTEDQRAVYTQVLEASRREMLEAVDTQGLARSRMLVLTALLRLRQICCDLRLLPIDPGQTAVADPSADIASAPAASGKVELFTELLEEVLDGGHRVLVFSQFTRMLALLRDDLAARSIEFCYLDGNTRDRAGVVERFQQDPRIPVFLISLKAGGVGLNLTGADTVIHFDPWWNPAVESQATDRAHRIGQHRIVTSYKLITRGTVEEKILNLQARKRGLIQGMLGDEELTQALTWEEIQDLLSA